MSPGENIMPINIVPTEDFEELRKTDGWYVDKTGFLVDFFRNDAHPDRFDSPKAPAVLFTRPRRFGKTLFMSMLANFFDMSRDSREIFAGLKVAAHERLCQEWMNKFPVISFTFKDVDSRSFEGALKDFHALFRNFCVRHKYLLTSEKVADDDRDNIRYYLSRSEDEDEHTLKQALRVLTSALTSHHGQKTILLIDEYDSPLQGSAEYGYYDQLLPFMRTLLSSGLKTNSENLRLAVLTGILRLAKESQFSKVNNLRCYDIASVSFSNLFGFTQDEVDSILAAEGIEGKRDVIKEWYDGYCFGKRSDIYNPWSIMEYLSDLKNDHSADPTAYWIDTGKNSLPQDFAKRLPRKEDAHGKIASLSAGYGIPVALNLDMNYDVVYQNADNFWTLLYLLGYLTLAKEPSICPDKIRKGEKVLVIPNREILDIFEREVGSWLSKHLPENLTTLLCTALWKKDASGLERAMRELLLGTSVKHGKESDFHAIVYAVYRVEYPGTNSEGESGKGFYDIFVPDPENSRAAVIELKLSPTRDKMEELAIAALKQIEDREYDARAKMEKDFRSILHVGMAFCQKSVKVFFRDASD